MSKINLFFKRTFDILFSLIIILLIAPILLLTSIAIKLDSKGPVLNRVTRFGPNGKSFSMYRFRTMHINIENSGIAKMALENDARITRLGLFLRKTSLDELPAFLNVFFGDMSIVGPRPQIANIAYLYFKKLNIHPNKNIKPGITGWAQVSYSNDDLGMEDTLDKLARYDNYYIENWSLWFDFRILALTVIKGYKHS
ncbi:TPA: exopolysaccharide biosynthesis protein [Vibrio parahaemolyticus]|nr:exopolysaccharide biosynthesis protein [Vibrio parahaemolyticus]HCG5486990.1 sugar transferase [Vibrio parahaemolyticus]